MIDEQNCGLVVQGLVETPNNGCDLALDRVLMPCLILGLSGNAPEAWGQLRFAVKGWWCACAF
jgi:hypothetical protein